MKSLRSSRMRTASKKQALSSYGSSVSSLQLVITTGFTGFTMEYYKQIDDYHVYKNIINTQTKKTLTTTELENILNINNIKIDRKGGYYNVSIKGGKLDLGDAGSSIMLKKCDNNCISGFLFYVDYIEPSTPSTPPPPKKDFILSVYIAPYLIPKFTFPFISPIEIPADPVKINSIKFVANISMEYDSQAYGYSIYKNVKNTNTNQQLTQTDLKNILSSYNIEFGRNGIYYDINTNNQLDLGNNSIILQKCVPCYKHGFGFYVVYDYDNTEKDLISMVQINTYMFPPDVDPTKITYINFVGN